VPGSSVKPAFAEHTDATIFWPALIVLTAVPVPPVTEPEIVNRLVAPFAHFPNPLAVANLTFPFVVPCLVAHVTVTLSVPAFDVDETKVPPPLPPVAVVGVHFDSVITVFLPDTFDVNAPHCGPAAAPAGAAINPTDSTIAAANNTPPTLRILMLPSDESLRIGQSLTVTTGESHTSGQVIVQEAKRKRADLPLNPVLAEWSADHDQ